MALPDSLTIFWNKRGNFPTSNYGKLLNNTVNPGIIPPGMTQICLVRSRTGGNLVWKGNDNVTYQFEMLPNELYTLAIAVGDNTANAQFLASGTDWQTNPATNDVTDLEIYGF